MASIAEYCVPLGAAKRILLEDVLMVAQCNYFATVDSSSLEKANDSILKECFFVDSSTSLMTRTFEKSSTPLAFCRAALFCRIVSLVNSQSVRSVIIERLCKLLESNIIPAFSSEEAAGFELLAVLSRSSAVSCYVSDTSTVQSADVATQNMEVFDLKFTATEWKTLQSGHFFAVGVGCYLGAVAARAGCVLDCTAALSCDALGANADANVLASLDTQLYDVGHQHRGQMVSASNMRLLLDGSARLSAKALDSVTDPAPCLTSFVQIPQVHGPLFEISTSTVKMLEIELNSYQMDPNLPFDSSQIVVAVQMLIAAFSRAWEASDNRSLALASGGVPSYVEEKREYARSTLLNYSLQLEYVLRAMSNTLAAEATVALKVFDTLDAANAADEAAKAASTDAHQGKRAGEDDEAPIDPSLPDAVRAKIEEKRRKNAEAKAKKAAAKASKKKGNVAVLGVGSTRLRDKLGALGGVTSLKTVFDPFAVRREGNGFHAFCKSLIEELGSGGCRRPRIAKGARDFGAESMRVREQAFSSIRKVFKRHGAVEIDTPVFELKEVLTGKYGEDSKLIYDLADQGGELLCLRYDLTVPFARYLAMNSVGNIKRYHIAKVYRRDQPQPARGRFREFYQCDIDIAGNYSLMVADAEVISVCAEILSDLPIGKFMIKLNHRRILDAVFEICGVPADKFRPICSAVDKLDKETWENVKLEMTVEKGLDPAVADRIGEFVLHAGKPKELWEMMTTTKVFGSHAGAASAMSELKLLFDYLEAMGTLQYVSFDLSLARGLDYYTGVIYEAVLVDGTSSVGSIAAGGRYDNLVGMFSVSGQQTPCVGVSIGVERVFAIMESRAKAVKATATSTMQVFVASIGADLIADRMKVARLLWGANIAAEYSHQDNPKFKKQLDYVLEQGIPFVVVFGEEELSNGTVKVKCIEGHSEEVIPLTEMVPYLLAHGCTQVTNSVDSVMMEKMRDMTIKEA